MEPLVGFRFHPTDMEVIDYYLHNKIQGKNTWLLNRAMNEVNIYNFDPWQLQSQSKISSDDPVWFFFCPRDNTNPKKKGTKRTTSSGYWKATGVDRKIKGKGNSGEIGLKKTLVFYFGRVPKGVRTPYVMHEYHSSVLSPEQRTYVICKVKYKGEDADISYSTGSEPSNSLASNLNNVDTDVMSWGKQLLAQGTPESFYGSENDIAMASNHHDGLSLWDVDNWDELGGNPNVQLQTPFWTQNDNELPSRLMDVNQEDWDYMFAEQGQATYNNHMQENYNDYRPQKALTGVYVDSGSDSDAESISAKSYQETSSPVNSVDSSNGHFQNGLDALHIDGILSLDPKEQAITSNKSCTRRKAGGSQSQQKYKNCVPRGRLQQLELQSGSELVLSPKQEVRKVAEGASAAAPSKNEMELKMSLVTNKKTSTAITVKEKGCFIFQGVVEEGSESPRYVYLAKTILGIILLVFLVCEVISVR